MPTIDDVSRLANVSRATVSRVLTGTRGVREESREAVLRAVEELNYRPSFAAQNLASQTSSHVGLVISAQDESNGARLLPLLSQALKGLNKSLLVQYVSDPVEQAAVIDDLQRQCVAVVVLGAVAATRRATLSPLTASASPGATARAMTSPLPPKAPAAM